MIRFRRREDETRYMRLMSELYREAAPHLPPGSMTTLMRNLGKMQDMLLLEGVRQGAAAAAVSTVAGRIERSSLEHLKAFQLHAHVYGSSDTPLVDAEAYWLTKLGAEDARAHAWLDPEPMRFAPETAIEALGAPEAAASARPSGSLSVEEDDVATAVASLRVAEGGIVEAARRFVDELDDDLAGEPMQSEPDLLDRVRDTLQHFAASGAAPGDYQDLVLRLHIALKVDAAWLDMQLSTEEGRTVLAQTGNGHLTPGPYGLNLTLIDEAASTREPARAPRQVP
jgi:hypothetical protein